MHRSNIPLSAILYLLLIMGGATATPSVRVYSYEEAISQNNYSKPRIYITNLSATESISNFSLCYYFTAENNKIPIIADYYTPNSAPSLQSLGNGNYLVRFTFTGITLRPGQTLPNNGGNVIGLHYSDDSYFDKTNDYSNNLASSFTLNANITVFLGDGTLIYGTPQSSGGPPPQPPLVSADIGSFAIYSSNFTDIRNQVKIKGNVGSMDYMEVGCDDTINGDAFSGGNMELHDRAVILGNVLSKKNIIKRNGVVISGSDRSKALLALPSLSNSIIDFSTSVSPVNIFSGSYTLTPGSYSSFHAYSGSTITILPGIYTFHEFILEPNVRLIADLNSGGKVMVNVRDKCSIGNDATINSIPLGTTVPAVSFFSKQTSMLYIGTDAEINAIFLAPEAEIHVYPRTSIMGMLYGKRVIIEPGSNVCISPTLLGLSHSEGAMAPPFSPIRFSYVAVVPDATATVLIMPQIRDGTTVTVNGNDPSSPVNLGSGTETDIVMLLTHPESCGSTEYHLKVIRSADDAIYVNQNNTGIEDGKTYTTGYSDLQHALDIAAEQGKEVRVAEGVYTPTKRVDATDPRSATFIINAGTEITGGYTGTETGKEPEGGVTVFSGDIFGNDTSLADWPATPSEKTIVADNLYHIITVTGDCKISNISVTHGNSNGNGENAIGGGMLIKNGNAHLDFVKIIDNSTDSGGALYVSESGAIDTLKNCLIKNNISQFSSGGGLKYESTRPLVVNASVFDENSTTDTSSGQGGSAIYFSETSMYLLNCVFSRNHSESVNGAIYNDGGNLYADFCTFAFNTGNGAVSICNKDSAKAEILNSILWNTTSSNETSGSGFVINFTCITNGFAGYANISSNPLFKDPGKPAGSDGEWGSYDDGLQLSESSPCVDESYWYSEIDVDILTTERLTGPENDRGAYEYVEFANNLQRYLGIKYGSGQFKYDNNIHIYKPFDNEWRRILAVKSNNARYVRALVPISDYTRNKPTIISYVYPKVGDSIITDVERIKVLLVREGESSGSYVYYSDKPLLFIDDKEYVKIMAQNASSDGYYMYAKNVSAFGYRCIIPSSQF